MSQKKLLGLLGALALVAFAAGCSSKECSVNADCASKGANFACVNNACLEQTPKTCSPACSGSTPVCNTATLTCVACTQNTDCSGATPACDTSTNTCVACTSNAQCGGSTPACDSASHTCVACAANSDCSGSTPVCDTAAHACVGCVSNANCSGATPVCDTGAQVCVGCLGNADCSGSATGNVCDTSTHSCVACTQNADCGGSTPICDTANHTCTASCTTDAECASTSPTTPKCDTAKSVCVACLGNADCAGNANGTVCSPTNTCVECVGNSDCTGNANGTVCNTSNDTCVQCLAQTDCAATPTTPSCNTTSDTCVAACVNQTDCTISQDCTDGGQGKYCTDVDVAAASTAISAIKSAAIAGTTTSAQAVNGAIVTYLKPQSLSTTDPAGFFVQAEATGPGLFIAIPPANLTPAPAIGDRVAFTASTLAYNANQSSVTDFAANSWQVLSSGHDVSKLRVDASAATDLVTALDTYESKIGSLTFTVSAAPTNANTGYMQAFITTAGYLSGDPALKFYAPATTFANKDLTNGCAATINGVMWRYKANAEPAVFADGDLTVTTCPAPKLLSAARTSATEVDLTFDRNIDPATITIAGFQITETATPTNILAVTGAVAGSNARTVVLTTANQGPNVAYTVTVNATVKDDAGTSVDSNANTAGFNGFVGPAVLRFTEINPEISSGNGGDRIELVATTGGALDNQKIVELASNVASPSTVIAFPAGVVVQANDVILVHLMGASTCSETATKGDCTDPKASSTAWDYSSSVSVSYTSKVFEVLNPSGTAYEGAAFTAGSTSSQPGQFAQAVRAIEDAGLWTGSSCPANATSTDLAACEADAASWAGFNTSSTTGQLDTVSASRSSPVATPGDKTQWSTGNASWGTYP